MEEIGLQEFIDEVKRELLTPNKDPDPLFFIDRIELEMAVKVTKEGQGGVKVSVLGFFEGAANAALARERGNMVRVSISPLLERDEIIKKLKEDPRWEITRRTSEHAFMKGDDIEGEQ